MRIDIRPRQTGKTTDLIKECHETGGYIVCSNLREADRVFREAKRLGKPINLPITFNDFIYRTYSDMGIEKLYIDNVDMLLQHMTKVPIEKITISPE